MLLGVSVFIFRVNKVEFSAIEIFVLISLIIDFSVRFFEMGRERGDGAVSFA